MYQSFIMEVES